VILEKLFNKYNTDKSEKHGYHMVYEKYFEPYKNQKIKILEVGVWEGASTLALHEYFDSAEIYGVDIFERFPMESIRPYSLERCQFIQGDFSYKDKYFHNLNILLIYKNTTIDYIIKMNFKCFMT